MYEAPCHKCNLGVCWYADHEPEGSKECSSCLLKNMFKPVISLKPLIHFKELTQTCGACPSQWEAKDHEGFNYYIRYRFGNLTVIKSNEPGSEATITGGGSYIVNLSHGGSMDGVLDTNAMLSLVGATFE